MWWYTVCTGSIQALRDSLPICYEPLSIEHLRPDPQLHSKRQTHFVPGLSFYLCCCCGVINRKLLWPSRHGKKSCRTHRSKSKKTKPADQFKLRYCWRANIRMTDCCCSLTENGSINQSNTVCKSPHYLLASMKIYGPRPLPRRVRVLQLVSCHCKCFSFSMVVSGSPKRW